MPFNTLNSIIQHSKVESFHSKRIASAITYHGYPRCRIGLQGGPLLTKDYQHSENHDSFT